LFEDLITAVRWSDGFEHSIEYSGEWISGVT